MGGDTQPARSVSIITPTIGRASLIRTLLSAPLEPGDEWLVIGDGPQPQAAEVVGTLSGLCQDRCPCGGKRGQYRYIEGPLTRQWGNAQRDLGMQIARGDYLLFCDDDDVFLPGALDRVRREAGDWPIVFRKRTRTGDVIWHAPVVAVGEIASGQLCIPNHDKRRLGRWSGWANEYTADYEFLRDTLERWPHVVWSGEIIQRAL